MQKKSLLVALFCGALCLTGCLKNEESASVAQVRIAKANELNSIADLNKAKAAAEAVYAQAELTVANAEAKLREANAALVLAQAETEKVRAELLKVQVALAEVKVDEEKVRLQMLEADLEQKLAEVEAAVAMAEAEKQGWINVLNHAIADAERQALVDAKAILMAENDLENYLLTQEGIKADSAKVYSKKYFAALDELQKLQFQQIKIKAQKALVEAGALEVRDAIYAAIDDIDAQIEENEAIIAILKERQAMTPEEAKVAIAEAKLALEDAYTKKVFADSVVSYADTYLSELKTKKADYSDGAKWKNDFKDPFKALLGEDDFDGRIRTAPAGVVISDRPVGPVRPSTPKFISREYVGGHKSIAGILPSKKVQYYGVYVVDEEVDPDEWEFIPLWTTLKDTYTGKYNKWAGEEATEQRYPDIDVYEGEGKDFVTLTTTAIAPAEIDFEAVNEVLDDFVAEAKATAANIIKKEEEVNIPARVAEWNEAITVLTDSLALHKAYVDERKAAVTAAEKAYLKELEANDSTDAAKVTAWEKFQNYMVTKYDVDRMLFVDQYNKQKAYDTAKDDVETADGLLQAAIAKIPGDKAAVITAADNEAKAEGDYVKALKESAEATTEWSAYQTALGKWNPNFDIETAKKVNPAAAPSYTNEWKDANNESAKTAQKDLLNAQDSLALAQLDEHVAQMTLWRNPRGTAGYNAALDSYNEYKAKLDDREAKVESMQSAYDRAQRGYNTAKAAWDEAAGADLEEATKNWNIEFGAVSTYINGFQDVYAKPDTLQGTIAKAKTGKNAGKWIKKGSNPEVVAGDKQAALIDKVLELAAAKRDTCRTVEGSAMANYINAVEDAETALAALNTANSRLLNALKATTNKEYESIEDALDDDAIILWNAYKTAKENVTKEKHVAWAKLIKLYAYNPNFIQSTANPDYDNWTYNEDLWNDVFKAQFSWVRSSYYVDPEAKILCPDGHYRYIAFVFGQDKARDKNGNYILEEDEKGIQDGEKIYVPAFDYKCKSMAYRIETLQSFVEGKDEYLAEFKADVNKTLQSLVDDIEAVRAGVMTYKSHETTYLAWIKDITNAEKGLNELKKAAFDANKEYKTAKAVYEGVKYIADGFVYVYVGKGVTGADEEGFMTLNINDAIEHLEGETDGLYDVVKGLYSAVNGTINKSNNRQLTDIDLNDITSGVEAVAKVKGLKGINSIAELTFAKELLQNALKYGKVALQYVLEAYDEEIAELDEKMEFWSILAEKYKAIMNIYLGIVPNDESETGPLDGEGEGDDEE